jgi:Glycosyl hydrolases family 16
MIRRRLVTLLALSAAMVAVVIDAGQASQTTAGATSLGLSRSAFVSAPRRAKRHCPRTALAAARTVRGRQRCRTYDPSGRPAPRGNLPGWRLAFVDDFRSRFRLGRFVRDRRWSDYTYPSKDTSSNGTYWPQRGLSTHDGVLDIWLHTERVNGTDVHVVNAPQPVIPGMKRGQLYGRYAIRFKADPVPGYKTAWLLWPDSGRRSEGEIDFPETNTLDGGTAHAFVHPIKYGSQAAFNSRVPEAGAWHTAVIVWTPSSCRFMLDGKQIGVDTHGIPDTPMHWVIQTETQLSGGPPPDSAAGHVYIDWVAIYART